MKKILLFALPLMVMCFASCEKKWTDDSPIIQFKDPKFLEGLLSNKSNKLDKNGDGQISEKEASVVTDVYVASDDIRNMDEIKYFTALTSLQCYSNQLTSLDVSKNTALRYLDCSYNQLTELDLSNNTYLLELYCTKNPLQKIILFQKNIIPYSYIHRIIEQYGDIIEYAE